MEALTLYGNPAEQEKANARAIIDEALEQVADVEKEKTAISPEYFNALEQIHEGLKLGTWGEHAQLLARIVIDSHKLIAENQILRVRLKGAVNDLLANALKGGRFSLCGR